MGLGHHIPHFLPGSGPVNQKPYKAQQQHSPSKAGQPSSRGQQASTRGQPSVRTQQSSGRGHQLNKGQQSSGRGPQLGRGHQASKRGQPSRRGQQSSGRVQQSGRGQQSSGRGQQLGRGLQASTRGQPSGRGRQSSGRVQQSGRGRQSSGRCQQLGRGLQASTRGQPSGRGPQKSVRDQQSGRVQQAFTGAQPSGRGKQPSSRGQCSRRGQQSSAKGQRSSRGQEQHKGQTANSHQQTGTQKGQQWVRGQPSSRGVSCQGMQRSRVRGSITINPNLCKGWSAQTVNISVKDPNVESVCEEVLVPPELLTGPEDDELSEYNDDVPETDDYLPGADDLPDGLYESNDLSELEYDLPEAEDYVSEAEDYLPEDYLPEAGDYPSEPEDDLPEGEDYLSEAEDYLLEDYLPEAEDYVPEAEDYVSDAEGYQPEAENDLSEAEDSEGATAENFLHGLSEDTLQTVITSIIKQKIAAGQTIDQAKIKELTELVKMKLKTDLNEIERTKGESQKDGDNDRHSEGSLVSTLTSESLSVADAKPCGRPQNHQKRRERTQQELQQKEDHSVLIDDASSVGTADDQRQHVDENAVFHLIVKEYHGSCLLSELAQTGRHLFPYGTDILQWFQTQKRMFKVFPTKMSEERPKTLIKVHLQGLQLCFNTGLRGCQTPNCQYIHLCRDYLMGNCSNSADQCRYSHRLLKDPHNKPLVEKKFSAGLYTEKDILNILLCSLIQVCPEYNAGNCENEKLYELCPKMHMCAAYAMNKCLQPEDVCGFSHSLDSENTQKLLVMFHCSRMKPDTLRKSLLVNKSLLSIDDNPPVSDVALEGASLDVKDLNPKQESKEKQPTGGKSTNKPKTKPRAAQSDTNRELEIVDVNIPSDDDKDICEMNVRQCCKFVGRCRNHHFPMPYLWQIFVSEVSEWKALDNWNSQIERLYCDPQNKDYCMVSKHISATMVNSYYHGTHGHYRSFTTIINQFS